jgi:hypothetical protein
LKLQISVGFSQNDLKILAKANNVPASLFPRVKTRGYLRKLFLLKLPLNLNYQFELKNK